MIILISCLILLLVSILIWRFYWFFRDPERVIPIGKSIVSPADGRIIYIKTIKKDDIGEKVFKKNKNIRFEGIPKLDYDTFYHIGIFMSLFDVHINRAPISGRVIYDRYFPSRRNSPMTMLSVKLVLGIKPYEKNIKHILENERNVMIIEGELPIYIIQIADIYVSKISNYISKDDDIDKGERMGVIKMGSQVDIIIPKTKNMKTIVSEGERVFAGVSEIVMY